MTNLLPLFFLPALGSGLFLIGSLLTELLFPCIHTQSAAAWCPTQPQEKKSENKVTPPPPKRAQPASSVRSPSNFCKMTASVARQLSSPRQIWGSECTDIIITRNTLQAPLPALVRPFLNHKAQSLSHSWLSGYENFCFLSFSLSTLQSFSLKL